MANLKRYPVARSMMQMAGLLDIDAGNVMRRAGLAPDFLENEGSGVTAKEFYALWQAVFDEVGDKHLALKLARQLAAAPVLPAMLAFSSSPNTEIGLTRLALFKPLVGPVKLEVKRSGGGLALTIGSSRLVASWSCPSSEESGSLEPSPSPAVGHGLTAPRSERCFGSSVTRWERASKTPECTRRWKSEPPPTG